MYDYIFAVKRPLDAQLMDVRGVVEEYTKFKEAYPLRQRTALGIEGGDVPEREVYPVSTTQPLTSTQRAELKDAFTQAGRDLKIYDIVEF